MGSGQVHDVIRVDKSPMQMYIQSVGDDELLELLDNYLAPPSDPNPAMVGVHVVWVRDNHDYGALHILEKHGVTEEEVLQVLLEVPPFVEAKRHPELPGRTLFWGATRYDRWLVVVCEDWKEEGSRFLKPITAFEPDSGDEYWRQR